MGNDDFAARVNFHDSNSQPYLLHLIDLLEDESNESVNALGIQFCYVMRDPRYPEENRPLKGNNGYDRKVFVRVVDDPDKASLEEFGQNLAAALTEIDQGKTFEYAGDATNLAEPDPACRLIMDKDVTEMAFLAYGDEIRDRSFFEHAETVKGYWGDRPNPLAIMQQFRDI